MEKKRIRFGNTEIDFLIRRSPRRGTVSLFVDPHEGVFVRAPLDTSVATLSRLVHSRGGWILDKQRRINEIKELLPNREFVSGETLLYLGKQYRLKILEARNNSVGLRGRYFTVRISSKHGRIVKDLMKRWYKLHALSVLKKRAEVYVKRLEIPVPNIGLGNHLKRWGSCVGSRRIYFNWQIVMAPMSLIDYVVAHELCHVKFHDHSQKYWNLLGRIMPDYEARRERLRKEGPKYFL